MVLLLMMLWLAQPPAPTEGRIGDLAYDATAWKVSETEAGYMVRCASSRCDSLDEPLWVSIVSGASCEAWTAEVDLRASGRGRAYSSIVKRPGMDIQVTAVHSACRNARPPSVQACGVYKGKVYRFDSPSIGCGGGPGFGDGPEEFLQGLQPK